MIDPTYFPISYESAESSAGTGSLSNASKIQDEKSSDDKQLVFVVSGFDNDAIFIVAHATVCGEFDDASSSDDDNDATDFQGTNPRSFRGGVEEVEASTMSATTWILLPSANI